MILLFGITTDTLPGYYDSDVSQHVPRRLVVSAHFAVWERAFFIPLRDKHEWGIAPLKDEMDACVNDLLARFDSSFDKLISEEMTGDEFNKWVNNEKDQVATALALSEVVVRGNIV